MIFAIFAIDVFPFFTNQRGWGKTVMPLKFGPWRSKHLGTLIQTEFDLHTVSFINHRILSQKLIPTPQKWPKIVVAANIVNLNDLGQFEQQLLQKFLCVSLNIFLELLKNDLGSLTSRTRKSSFLIYNFYRTGIKCPKQAGHYMDHQVKTSLFHLRWLMLIRRIYYFVFAFITSVSTSIISILIF